MPYIVHPAISESRVDLQKELYQYPYINYPGYQYQGHSAVEYYQDGHHTLPTGQYAVTGHPSDKRVGFNSRLSGGSRNIYMDTVEAIGTFKNVTMVRSPLVKSVPAYEQHARSQGHLFGYGRCHWIRHCDSSTEMVGSPCSANHGGVQFDGYCFESSHSTLECGAMTALYGNFLQKKIEIDHPVLGGAASAGPYRCPRNAAVNYMGSTLDVRLLIGGCMISNDTAHSAFADVHVPSMCAEPAEFRLGCMLPGAGNFDALAVQPGECWFPGTPGCTSTTALNFDEEAGLDDGSCIETVFGCTIATAQYAGVDSDTPGYNSGTVMGVAWPQQQSVLNYDASANVPRDCVLAIEGCMDTSATNYDKDATVNSNTWCIPAIVGCMMPDSSTLLRPAGLEHQRDGLAATYNPSATVDGGCVIARFGCMSSTALNYDSDATVSFDCYEPRIGCLDRRALNFGCVRSTVTTPCVDERVSVHRAAVCVFDYLPPSPPPSPQYPPGVYSYEYRTVVILVLAGSLSDWTAERRLKLQTNYANVAGVSLSSVVVTYEAASVLTTVTIISESSALRDAVMVALAPHMASIDAAQAFLGEIVLLAPEMRAETVTLVSSPPPGAPPSPSGIDDVVVIGATTGLIAGFFLAAFLAWWFKDRCPRFREVPVVPTSSTTGVGGVELIKPGSGDEQQGGECSSSTAVWPPPYEAGGKGTVAVPPPMPDPSGIEEIGTSIADLDAVYPLRQEA